jgi:hypothetical protein
MTPTTDFLSKRYVIADPAEPRPLTSWRFVFLVVGIGLVFWAVVAVVVVWVRGLG